MFLVTLADSIKAHSGRGRVLSLKVQFYLIGSYTGRIVCLVK